MVTISGARSHGFTLVELLVTLTIFAILVGMALPSFTAFTVRNRLAVEASSIVGDLSLARSEAVRRGATVTACPSTDGLSCAGTTTWSAGRIIFLDGGVQGQVNGAADQVLRVTQDVKALDTITTSPAVTAISFVAGGTTTNVTRFTVCYPGYVGNYVTLTGIGRPRVTPMPGNCP